PGRKEAAVGRSTSIPLPADLRAAVKAYERELLERALEQARHNQRRAASLVGVSYDQLRHALKRHGLLQAG
ncbi:MAG: helix-turn-helix domain-containing protein, partial [Thermaurantiacus sp.]